MSHLIVAECDEKGKNAHECGFLMWKALMCIILVQSKIAGCKRGISGSTRTPAAGYEMHN